MAILLLIFGLLMFIGLIVVHEWGHFVMARRNGVDVEEFGIGFPPKIKGWKIHGKKTDKNKHLPASAHKGFEFTLNWLPLGGFVRLHGEHDSDTEPGTFGAASTWAKTKIMGAGIFMNFLTAYLLFVIVALIGMPKLLDNQYSVPSDTKVVKQVQNADVVKVGTLTKGSPAERAGLRKNDRIIAINGTKITSPTVLPSVTKQYAGKTVSIVSQRGDAAPKTQQVRLNDGSPYLGVGPYSGQTGYEIRRSTWSAPVTAAGIMYQFTIATFQGLGKALAGVGSMIAGLVTNNSTARAAGQSEASSQVSGPVGIFAVLQAGSHEGFAFVLFIIAIVSLSLAIMNLLPIPALDGGKLAVTYIARLFRRPVSEKVEDYVYTGSFLALMLLVVLITIVDVRRFF